MGAELPLGQSTFIAQADPFIFPDRRLFLQANRLISVFFEERKPL
jgi:hypothetical protein